MMTLEIQNATLELQNGGTLLTQSADGSVEYVAAIADVTLASIVSDVFYLATPIDQGPPGVDGPPGPAGVSVSFATAHADVVGNMVIMVDALGDVIYASAADVTHADRTLGVSTGSAVAGSTVSYASVGSMTESSWSWTPGPVYLGVAGALTQSTAGLAFIQQIGVAVTPTELLINIRPSIVLS